MLFGRAFSDGTSFPAPPYPWPTSPWNHLPIFCKTIGHNDHDKTTQLARINFGVARIAIGNSNKETPDESSESREVTV
jgi:hypothetical protein